MTKKFYIFAYTNREPMLNRIYNSLTEKKRHGKKSFAVLIDPDKVNNEKMQRLIDLAIGAKVDYFLVGGSLVISNYLDAVSYTHLRAHETVLDLVCRLLLEKKK